MDLYPHYHFIYPRRAHNRFELLIDGEHFYPAMLQHIADAKHIICIEQYLIISGKLVDDFITALTRAANRGVRVFLLLDDYGVRLLTNADRARLHTTGIQLCLYNPFSWSNLYRSLRRDHRKVFIVDGQSAYIGGAGLADNFIQPLHNEPVWHDVVIKIEGELVADWFDSFHVLWQTCTGQRIDFVLPAATTSGSQSGQVHVATSHFHNEIVRAALSHIHKAKTRIWIATPYFIITRKLRRFLRNAALHGVDVRLLLTGPHSDHPWVSHAARHHYHGLLRHGIRIFEYQPRFIHAKILLCDDWVSMGSSNLDRWNQRWNLDANQSVHSAEFTAQVTRLFTQDFAMSQEITTANWQQRPWRQRWHEGFFGRVLVVFSWLEYWFIYWHRK
jgi:phosphatidylserine/phosphatidylglycerophosphate/cardiolipin synthase-like enzyme